MKKLFLLFVSCFAYVFVQAQSDKIFDCGLFSFEYPNEFKNVPIQNAPHMVLKLESDTYFVSASFWDYGLDSSVSIWDDELVEHYSQIPIENGELVGISKELIQTKSGKQRCLKLKSNVKNTINENYSFKMAQYLMINKGFLFIFTFLSEGKYTKASPTSYPDKILGGLQFKNNEIGSTQFQERMASTAKTLNDQCPIRTDDCTIFKNVILSGKSLMINTLVEDACDDLVDYDEFKENMASNMSGALDKEFVKYIDKEGYSIVYMIYNERDKLKKIIRISGSDILRNYK